VREERCTVDKKKRRYGWLFLAPSLIVYVALFVYPAISAFRISFFRWTGFTKTMQFVGIRNYLKLFTSDDFYSSLKTTAILLVVGGIFIFLISFLFSVMFKTGIRGKRLYRNIIFLPYVVAPIVHAIFWGNLVYAPNDGIANRIFALLNIKFLAEFTFLANKNILGSIIAMVVWVFVGYFLIITMAGVDRIPPYLYDSARIEGANDFQLFFKITLPLMKDVLLIEIVLWEILAFKMFGLLYTFGILYPPRPLWTLGIFLILSGWGKGHTPSFQLGYASTIGIVMLLFVMLVSIITRIMFKREAYEY
jgi:ABC-type sugar transport system permease subunit